MKKTLLTFLIIISAGISTISSAQSQSSTSTDYKTRMVYFYVIDMDSQSDVTIVMDYLLKFNGKIIHASGNKDNQMVTVEFNQFTNEDIEEIIYQAGYKAIHCSSLPPSGLKYIFNPDGTWKTKEI